MVQALNERFRDEAPEPRRETEKGVNAARLQLLLIQWRVQCDRVRQLAAKREPASVRLLKTDFEQ